ncbi:MAG: alpha-L-rhamnosidase C-terminal domain-containing protein [Flavobacteriaceae bacterium]
MLVASSLDKLDKGVGDLWDSGSVESDKSLNIAYNGSALKLRTQYFWKVRISDASGTMTAWSTPTSLTMGMLSQDDWQANWIQSDLKLFDYQKELMQHADHNMEVEDSLRPRGKRISKMTEKVKENWQGGLVQMPSLARPIGAWFYRSLGGIRAGSPGFKSVIIQPYTHTLEWVNTTYESPYGTIESNWQKKDDVLTMNVVIPANTTATVYVPGKNVTESGMSAENSEGVDFNKNENGVNIFNVKAGEYNFIS